MTDVKLHKPEHFFERVDKYKSERDLTYLQAYQLTERDFRNVFGERKYASYASFKKCYNRQAG